MHRIVMADTGETFDPHSMLNNDFDFFERLQKLGQGAARRFLDTYFDDIGRRSTIEDQPDPAAEVA
jgi:NTE family protein